MLQEAAIKDLNMIINQDMITDTIRPHLDTKTISYLLNNKQQIINDSISLLNTVYSQDPARIMLKLLSLNHQNDLITPQDMSKQVTCNMSEDLLVYNQDSKDVSLVGTSLSPEFWI